MPRFQFSVRTLFFAVAVVALACGGLVYASPEWQALWGFLVSFALCLAVIGAVYRREEKRAFWVGFAVLGWGYAFLAPRLDAGVGGQGPSDALFARLWPLVQRGSPGAVYGTSPGPYYTMVPTAPYAQPLPPAISYLPAPGMTPAPAVSYAAPVFVQPSLPQFLGVGRQLTVLAVSVLGGLIARAMCLRRKSTLSGGSETG